MKNMRKRGELHNIKKHNSYNYKVVTKETFKKKRYLNKLWLKNHR